jgi:hypothetical protein
MKLTVEQVDHIRNVIGKSNITIETLRDDLLDHLCCVVENEISQGQSFELSLANAMINLAPNGLHEIQRQTIFLLHAPKIIRMKKVMYFIGLLSAMSFVLGWTFGMMHWPGATQLSIGGFLGFIFVFIPLSAMDYFKTKIHRALTEKLRLSLGILSALTVAAAVIFKLLHLRGADILLLSGAGLFIFGFLPFLFFTMYRKSVT